MCHTTETLSFSKCSCARLRSATDRRQHDLRCLFQLQIYFFDNIRVNVRLVPSKALNTYIYPRFITLAEQSVLQSKRAVCNATDFTLSSSWESRHRNLLIELLLQCSFVGKLYIYCHWTSSLLNFNLLALIADICLFWVQQTALFFSFSLWLIHTNCKHTDTQTLLCLCHNYMCCVDLRVDMNIHMYQRKTAHCTESELSSREHDVDVMFGV